MNNSIEQQLIDIEIALANQQKTIDEISDVVFKQGLLIDKLTKQNELLKSMITQDVVKPMSEELPPPHY
jgi:uncharacterized coiled-coil protein SlyX